MRRFKGVALPDYALTLGLVTLVGAVALSLSGNTIRDFYNNTAKQLSLPGMESPADPQNQTTPSAQTDGQGTTGKETSDGSNTPKPYPTQKVSLRLPDGRVLALSDYPEDMGKAVETAGADGTTKSLANFMSVMAEQLKASGQINDKQYNSLIALSNQGFRIGELQNKVQQAYTLSGGNDDTYLQKLNELGLSARPSDNTLTIVENKHPIVVDDLYIATPAREMVEGMTSSYVGNNQGLSDEAIHSNLKVTTPSMATSDTAKLLYYLELAKRSGALDNPATNTIVQFATRDIVRLANAAGNAYSKQEIAKNITDIRDNSTTICNVGGGSASTGLQCDK